MGSAAANTALGLAQRLEIEVEALKKRLAALEEAGKPRPAQPNKGTLSGRYGDVDDTRFSND